MLFESRTRFFLDFLVLFQVLEKILARQNALRHQIRNGNDIQSARKRDPDALRNRRIHRNQSLVPCHGVPEIALLGFAQILFGTAQSFIIRNQLLFRTDDFGRDSAIILHG